MGQRQRDGRDARVSAEELVTLACCDLGAIVRGRSLFASELEPHLSSGVSWVPANLSLTPLGSLAEPNPFGSIGDLRLLPDPSTSARVQSARDDGAGAFELVLCDIVENDGQPWDCCPRRFLRDALDELESELGVRVLASFEHEFQLRRDAPAPLAFSLDAQRRAGLFAVMLMDALVQAELRPERFLAEYAPHQYEVPVQPSEGLAIADRAIVFREVVREIARREGTRVSFAPLLDPASAGNGVHIHLSLLDESGGPVLYDDARPGALSELGGRFAAGILRHARALSALCAPSPASGARLQPHRWSAGAVCLAKGSREALLRIPTPVTLAGGDPAPQLRLEYRGADATANPYLALGAILRAGLEGVRAPLEPAPVLDRDPSDLQAAEIERFGVGGLPESLEDALRALAEDGTVRGWMAPRLYDAYAGVKRAELQAVAGLDLEEVCRRYGEAY